MRVLALGLVLLITGNLHRCKVAEVSGPAAGGGTLELGTIAIDIEDHGPDTVLVKAGAEAKSSLSGRVDRFGICVLAVDAKGMTVNIVRIADEKHGTEGLDSKISEGQVWKIQPLGQQRPVRPITVKAFLLVTFSDPRAAMPESGVVAEKHTVK